jgi:hemolysin activation/secretion protein
MSTSSRIYPIALGLSLLPLFSEAQFHSTYAQTTPFPPGTVNPGRNLLPSDRPPTPPIPSEPKPLPSPPVTSPTPAPTASPTVPICQPSTLKVNGFRFEPRDKKDKIAAFSTAELENALKSEFIGKELTCAQLVQAAQTIEKKYVEAGYLNSGAALPVGGVIDQGIVPIVIVEGSLEEIRVCFGNAALSPTENRYEPCSKQAKRHRLHPEYIRSRIQAAVGKPFNFKNLRDQLLLLKLNPLIQDVRAQLSPSNNQGQSILTIEVVEGKPQTLALGLDGNRSPSVGDFQRQLQYSHLNLTGWGDQLDATYSNTNGSNTFNLSYTRPVNPRDGTLKLNLGLGISNIIESPFDVLDIQSITRSIDFTYRQPIVRKPNKETALGFTLSHRNSNATLLDGLVPFPSIGAEADGHVRVTALRFTQEALWRNPKSIFGLRSQFSLGLGFLGTQNDYSPDGGFMSWLGQAQWARQTGLGTLVLRTNLQFSDRPLVPAEQFGLGGQDSLRGYRQDVLLTDNGLLASAELRVPVWRSYQTNSLLEIVPFADFGAGWNSRWTVPNATPTPERNILATIGLGLRLQMNDKFSARLDWGIPLIKAPDVTIEGKHTFQENGIYFSLNYKIF